jgi:hypothetical protein
MKPTSSIKNSSWSRMSSRLIFCLFSMENLIYEHSILMLSISRKNLSPSLSSISLYVLSAFAFKSEMTLLAICFTSSNLILNRLSIFNYSQMKHFFINWKFLGLLIEDTVQTIRKLERKILFSVTETNFIKTKTNFLETKILCLVTASKFLGTKNLFSVTKLFEYATNILICNDRNVDVCLHYDNYIKMNLIKTYCVQKICFCFRKQNFCFQKICFCFQKQDFSLQLSYCLYCIWFFSKFL